MEKGIAPTDAALATPDGRVPIARQLTALESRIAPTEVHALQFRMLFLFAPVTRVSLVPTAQNWFVLENRCAATEVCARLLMTNRLVFAITGLMETPVKDAWQILHHRRVTNV